MARSLIEDPLGRETLPVGVGVDAQTSLDELRRRIAEVYVEQLRLKVIEILAWCAKWNVDVVVFPEYSLPPGLLGDIARVSRNMVVVAGSHTVDRAPLREKLYEGLGLPSQPVLGTAVSPVLHGGKLIACVPKLHPSPVDGEREALVPGSNWAPVDLPEGMIGPMGVLLCIDFIDDQNEQVRDAVSAQLDSVRFWAVPSYTPQIDDFHEQSRKHAARYKKPTLYANGSDKGGSGVFVDIRTPNGAGLPWQLSAKEEGVLVVDVDLRDVPPGKSTAYGARAAARVIAAPSLVYKSIQLDAVYAEWHGQLSDIFAGGGGDLERLERAAGKKDELLRMLKRGTIAPTRRNRLQRFAGTVEEVSKTEEIESLTAEIILPPSILPLNLLEFALCKGARAVVRSWSPGALDETERVEIDQKLAAGRRPIESGQYVPTTADARQEIKRIVDRVRNDAPPFDEPQQMALRLEVYSTVLKGVWKKDYEEARDLLNGEKYEDAASRIEVLSHAIGECLAKTPDDTDALTWKNRIQILRSLLHLNCQERAQARAAAHAIDPEHLGPNECLSLARIWAELEEEKKSAGWLSRAESGQGSELDQKMLAVTRQIVAIRSGRMPELDQLVEDPGIFLRAAQLSLDQGALAQGVEYARRAVAAETTSLMQLVGACSIVVPALQWSIFELAEGASLLTPSEIEATASLAELWLERLEQPGGGLRALPLPARVVDQLEASRFAYYYAIAEPDHAERSLRQNDTDASNLEKAFRLARDGRIDEALALLPRTEHPWLPELQRADFLSLAGRDEPSLDLLRNLVGKYPQRGPIEFVLAQQELRLGDPTAAVKHAELAYQRVPARGYRWLLARCLFKNGGAEAAWEILSKERGRGGSNILVLLANISKTVQPSATPALLEELVKRHPENIQLHLELAASHGRLGQTEKAAETAWLAYLRHHDKFKAGDLYRCAELQFSHDTRGLRSTERVRRLVRSLHERFSGEPQAEAYKLQLKSRLGEDTELPDIDFGVLEEHGLVQRLNTEELFQVLDASRQRGEAEIRLYAAGAIPISTLAELQNQPIVEIVDSILRGRGPKVCAALPSSGSPSRPYDVEIVATDVELLAIAKLRLLQPLVDALRRGGSTLLVPEEYYKRLDEMRATVHRSAASELVRQALELVHTGMEQGWAKIPTWREAQEGPAARAVPEKPRLREAELGVQADRWRAIVEKPMHEAIDLSAVVLASPRRWRLAIDFYGTRSPGTPELMRLLEWTSADHATRTSWLLRSAGQRCLTLPQLVRILSEDRAANSLPGILEQLARCGFPDALNGAELVERARESADVQFPAETLSGLENMARQDNLVIATVARGHLQDTYSNAIAQAFLGEWRDEDPLDDAIAGASSLPYAASAARFGGSNGGPLPLERAHWLTTGLLERLETLDGQGSTMLEAVMSGALILALREPLNAVVPDLQDNARAILSLTSPVGRLVDTIRGWAGPNGTRCAAWERAVRVSWCQVDKFAGEGGPSTALTAALLLASGSPLEWGKPNQSASPTEIPEPSHAIRKPAKEALAILSANWNERPLNRQGLAVPLQTGDRAEERQFDWEMLLVHAAGSLDPGACAEGRAGFNEREFRSSLPIPEAPEHIPISLPVEAVLLRATPESARTAFGRLSELQGGHDGTAYRLLQRLVEAPNDPGFRAEYARHTVLAPWRLVRDDPSFLMRWPQSHTTGFGVSFPKLEDLLSTLHEPTQPLGAVAGAMKLIETRLAHTWRDLREEVRDALHSQLLLLPGATQGHVAGDVNHLAHSVDVALGRLECAAEVPSGLLAQDIMTLRMAMQVSPVLDLSRGTVDLRELVPRTIAEAVRIIGGGDLPTGTMAEHEVTSLRACASVCARFLQYQPNRGQSDWLWLTYRLHAWFLVQMAEVSPSQRQEGISALAQLAPSEVATAPNEEPVPDLFNPRFFAARKFDYRLAMVLFGLVASDNWARANGAESESNESVLPVSTPGLERLLLDLAGNSPPACVQVGSWFNWPLPANTADLALVSLLQLNVERVLELPEQSLITRIESWPIELSTLGRGQRVCVSALVIALTQQIRGVPQTIRAALETKLLAWKSPDDIATMLRWHGLASLFGAGAAHLKDIAWRLVCERYEDPLTPVVLGWYLEGAARAGGTLEGEVERLSDLWKGKGPERADPLVLALARLTMHAEREVQTEARTLMVALAGRPEFRDSSLLKELVKHLRLSDLENGQ